MALFSFESLLAALDLTETEPDHYQAPNIDLDYHRIFGGQLLAQSIVAAAASAPGKQVKSVACLFPREGSTDRPVELAVQRPHDGRSFASRRITAEQDGKAYLLADVSLHVPEPGLEHQAELAELPGPGESRPAEADPVELSMIPWETRVVDGVDLAARDAGPPTFALWTRVEAPLPEDPTVHQALLAHATDLTVIGTALRPHDGYSQADAGSRLLTAVTSHTVWFHRSFRLDDWCLLSQHAPVTAAGRGFGIGHVFDAGGRLVASYAQESMLRLLDAP